MRLKASTTEFIWMYGKSGNSTLAGHSPYAGLRANPAMIEGTTVFTDALLVPTIAEFTHNGGAVGTAANYSHTINGTAKSLAASSNSGGATNTNEIGEDGGGGGKLAGDYGEIIVCNQLLSPANVAKTRTYLAKRWNVTIA
jgi:hypothetical protein